MNAILNISSKIPIIYSSCDATLEIPDEIGKFESLVVLSLNHRRVGERKDLADLIHQMGYKAATGVINPVPENPVQKMNDFFAMGFDYVFAQGIKYLQIKQ